ncbi:MULTISPECIES: amino acid permease [Mammaliicoccus]|uniref:Amino acid permease n=1 Tax=Mammaliicoccus vitulinus TaxID=71237 RepID=A0A2T4PVQ0_9STAP|nr:MULTISPECIES: amino acid permease [Mammaliicoccus]HAL08489.1 amino acid permease [Staphylococcus sp.]MBM6630183.1 amino acid permease [Mammaliicoccus vitulinus]MBO3078264.1 amino acid permease [Mammaliicoccus vitulinus]PNZ38852.1 amino acid permease [Mammaliicoccus vitulinus]PTI30455.1 amino acid permease [Mammaliicoccus vitulinus]
MEDHELKRSMSNRHIQLIAIGGAIGTGLFLGAGKSISLAGPSILLVYIIIGFFLFIMMRALGELLLSNSDYNSFIDIAEHYLGPLFGFLTGWTYWFCWVATGIADITAVAKYIQFWYPDVPSYVSAIATVVILLGLNLMTVKLFGEVEFWFALIKIIAIVLLIAIGLWMILNGFKSSTGIQSGFHNLYSHGGVFPNGAMGFLLAFQMAVFSFVGIELVGVTARETKNPEKNLPKAVNSIGIRILIFYVLSLLIIMSITPWNKIDPDESPFVSLFVLAGIPAAAGIVNFVVLTSAASAANSGLFSNSRMVYGLGQTGHAPKTLSKTNRRGVPYPALIFSGVVLFLAAILNYFIPDDVFTLVTTLATIFFIFIWSIILICYIKFRKEDADLHEKSKFKNPFGVIGSYLSLLFFAFVLVILFFAEDTRTALLYSPLWIIMLLVVYYVNQRKQANKH